MGNYLYQVHCTNQKKLLWIFTLQSIKKHYNTPGDCFTAMLREWLQSSPNPTWSNLVEALRSPDIDRSDIADEIEDVYIKSDDSSLQESKDTAGEYCVTAWLHWHACTHFLMR